MPDPNSDVQVIDNTNITVRTDCRQTDLTTSNGAISTTFSTAGTGTSFQARLSTSDSSYPPTDGAALAELIEYAKDMSDHWAKVKEVLEQNAASDSDEDNP